MPSLNIRLSLLIKNNDGDVRAFITATDDSSDIQLFTTSLSAHQFTQLLAGTIVTETASLTSRENLRYLGQRPEYEVHVPSSSDLRVPPDDTSTYTLDMIFYGEAYRAHFGWDSATWHFTDTDGWSLFLVRWSRVTDS